MIERDLVAQVDALLDDPDEHAILHERADRQVAQWSLPGIPAYTLSLLLIGFGAGFAADMPWFYWGAVIVSVVVAVLRVLWVLRFDELYPKSPGRWRRMTTSLLFIAAALLGGVTMVVVLRYGMGVGSLLALLITGFFASAAVFVYSHDRLLLVTYCGTLALPPMAALAYLGTPTSVTLAIGGVIYLVYVTYQGWKNHSQRWHFLGRGRLLEIDKHRLAEARDVADQANRAKTRFLAQMSHELRTPLTSIVGLSEQLERPVISFEDRRRTVAAMHDAADLLLGLIDDVLDLARSEEGEITLRPAPFSPRPLVEGLVDLFQPRAQATGIVLTSSVSKGVPTHVVGDGGRLRQVLINLVGNAIKHTGAGSVHVQVNVEPSDTDHVALRFAVSDTGAGIDPAFAEQLFEPFVQGGSVREGVGLGLSICRRIVDYMGGKLELESERGAGSVFTFVLPFEHAEEGIEDAEPVTVVEPVAEPPSSSESEPERESMAEDSAIVADPEILIVEDNEINRSLFLQQLEVLGRRAQAVESGERALDYLEANRYQLILLDCMMPGLDGFETAERIRLLEKEHDLPRTPIVAVTANAFPDDQKACLAAGMDDWLAKPFRLHDLEQKVEEWLPGKPSVE